MVNIGTKQTTLKKFQVLRFVIDGFSIWSLPDMTCKPCIIPPDAPENYMCASVCNLEPRYVGIKAIFDNYFANMLSNFEEFHAIPDTYLESKNHMIVIGKYKGISIIVFLMVM